jgi:hypothetical protein
MNKDYFSLPRRRGVDNMGGMGVQVLFAPLDSFELGGIKGLKTTDAPGDSVTIDGAHTFKSGKGWHVAFATPESVKHMLESQGELGGKSKKASIELFRPGMSKIDAEFDRKSQNDEFLMLVKDPNTGRFVQLGSEDFPAMFTNSWDSADPSSGRKGFSYKAEAHQLGLQYYEGTIVYADEYASSGGPEDDATYVN